MNTVKITTWNVNGLYNKSQDYCKLDDSLFVNRILPYDIVGLVETHSSQDNRINVSDYFCFQNDRPKKSTARKASGGLAVLIKNSIRPGVKIVGSDQISIWLKLDKTFFNGQYDTYLSIVYIPPENSTFSLNTNVDPFQILERQVINYKRMGEIVIMGDLNARTATELDYIVNDGTDFIDSAYSVDQKMILRSNQDKVKNKSGNLLLELCVSASLRILNGRTAGDSLGSYTCHKYNGNSSVDYAIVSEDAINDIVYFYVHDELSDLSDHCQISMCINGLNFKSVQEDNSKFNVLPESFKWSETSDIRYYTSISSKQGTVQNLKDKLSNENMDINECVDSLSDLLLSAAKSSLKSKTVRNIKVTNRKKWYNNNLRLMRHELGKLGKLLHSRPHDPITRRNYFRLLRLYRKNCKGASRNFKTKLINKLDMLYSNNPSEYWQLLNSLKGTDNTMLHVEKNKLLDHYQQLNHMSMPLQAVHLDILTKLNDLEKQKNFSELDFKITDKEINDAIASLPNNKSAGPDLVINEMIKCARPLILCILNKIFNKILLSGKYPSVWAKGRIISILKSGDKNDPSNYRGITIASSLGKLFNSILNKRLTLYLQTNNIITPEQIGFTQKCRTTDHCFILKTIISKFRKTKKKLYIASIDLKKAFDSVWHQGLRYKLLQIGVPNHFYNVIKAMYDCTVLSVQHNGKISKEFKSNRGVRQGDNLSPSLFNIYTNDIKHIFDEQCSPVNWGEMKINFLMYADDLIILSETKNGLQTSLNRLKDYCDTWMLEVNTDKSKIMCITDQNDTVFEYDKTPLINIQELKYLGLTFNNKGDDNVMKKDLFKRGLKAYFKLLKTLQPLPEIDNMIHLFDRMLKPIITYGTEICTSVNLDFKQSNIPTVLNKIQSFHKSIHLLYPISSKFVEVQDPVEKLHMKFCKRILGVNNKTSNLGVYSELGRSPLYIDQIIQTVKFYYHIQMDHNKLLSKFWNNIPEKDLPRNNLKTFISKLSNIVDINIVGSARIKDTLKRLKTHLLDEFYMYWKVKITTDIPLSNNKTHKNLGNKLRTYRIFKSNIRREKYLKLKNIKLRTTIAKFRLSAHNLEIERGRFRDNKYITPDKRLCKYCALNSCEDELHFLLLCPFYTELRNTLFEHCISHNALFTNYNLYQKFIWLLTTEDLGILKQLGTFICNAMQKRYD